MGAALVLDSTREFYSVFQKEHDGSTERLQDGDIVDSEAKALYFSIRHVSTELSTRSGIKCVCL